MVRTCLKNSFPLPSREGVRGRGMSETEYDAVFTGDISHPHPIPPPSRGRGLNFEISSLEI
jgi:hypothetical protein